VKLAYFGCDLFMGCLDVFTAHNHDIAAIFTSGNEQEHKNIRAYAASRQILCIADKPTEQHVQMLADKGVDCFFSIEYNHLIPLPDSQVVTLNVHPSLLPEGRGVTPLSHIILHYPEYAGITFHKLTKTF